MQDNPSTRREILSHRQNITSQQRRILENTAKRILLVILGPELAQLDISCRAQKVSYRPLAIDLNWEFPM